MSTPAGTCSNDTSVPKASSPPSTTAPSSANSGGAKNHQWGWRSSATSSLSFSSFLGNGTGRSVSLVRAAGPATRCPQPQPSSVRRWSSMPKWWATSCTTVMVTCSTTSSSVRHMAQIGRRKMVMRSGMVSCPVPYHGVAGGERHALVAAEQPAVRDAVLDHHRDVVEQAAQLLGDAVEGVADQLVEPVRADLYHPGMVCLRIRSATLADGDMHDHLPDQRHAHLLDDLDDAQRRAVTSPARPLAIVAPAGSGKTRVLTRRIAWRVAERDADASHVLALTFTRKAAGELRERLAGLGLRDGVAAGTFHGVALAQLRSRWADEGRQPPAVLTRKAPVLGGVLVAGTPARWPCWRARSSGPRPGCRPGRLRRCRGRRPAAPARAPPSASPSSTAPYEERSGAAHGRLRRPAARCATPCSRPTRGSPPPSAGGSGTSSSTSSRTSTRCSCACSRPGGATAATCAWSATPTRRSTAGTGPTPASSRVSAASTRPPRSWCSTATTARRPRSWRPRPTSLRGGRGLTVCTVRPCRRPRQVSRATTHRPRRGPRHRPGRARPRTPAAPLVGPGRAGPHPRPARCLAEALRAAGIPHRVRGGDKLLGGPGRATRPRPAAPRDRPLAAALPDLEALADDADGAAGDSEEGTPADDLALVVQLRPRPPAPRPRRLGPRLPHPGSRPRCRPRERNGAATPSPWPRSTPPRAWSGPSSTWRGWRTGWCPSPMPAPASSGRRRRACCTWR